MSKDLGPDMLAHLENQRGSMTPAQYEARRIEVEQLIRSGKAIERTTGEKLMQALIVAVCTALGIAAGAGLSDGGSSPVGLVVFLALFVGGIFVARQVGRR